MVPRKSNLSREEILRRKREAERRRYERIKSDPAAYEVHMKKAAEKYVKRKEKGQVKLVSEMTAREHRAQKKQWRHRKKISLERTKKKSQLGEYLIENSPPLSETNEPSSSRRETGRKQVRRDRARVVRRNRKLEEENKMLKRNVDRMRQRLHRAKVRNNSLQNSPNSKVSKIMKSGDQTVRRQLLLHEVFTSQVLDGYKKLKRLKTKTELKEIIFRRNKFLRKYKLINQFRQLNDAIFQRKNRSVTKNHGVSHHVRKIEERVRLDVEKFFEQDDVSRICPGKKDTVTHKKIKKQKRYLSDTLANLHARFLKTYPCKISYSAFCILRPFWVLIPKVSDRDTCTCTHHENLSLIISSLHHAKIISCNNITALLTAVCCDPMSVKCLHRDCEACHERVVPYNKFDGSERIVYFQWVRKIETYKDKKSITRTVKKIKKEGYETTQIELVRTLEKKLESFFIHEGNVRHQYAQVSYLKKQLQKDEVLICADFSENYSLKCGTEVQSFHFGGSRQQITLHTTLVYFRQNEYTPLSCKSICTASECLDHSAGAIWAHLNPVFEWIKSQNPKITKCHFLTDGPSTQYKNKTIFYLLANAVKEIFPELELTTWNYHEAGHGKGPVDGVGGCVKRIADSCVASGEDISNFGTFIDLLDNNCRKIMIKQISAEEISAMNECIPSTIRPFRGTMRVHQAVYASNKPSTLKLNTLSCFQCYDCEKFSLGLHNPVGKEDLDELNPVEPLVVVTEDVEEQVDEHDTLQPPSPFCGSAEINKGDFVLVRFLAKKKFIFYVGQVTEQFSNNDYDVSFMRKTGTNFSFPAVKDISSIVLSDVVSKLKPPENKKRNRFFFHVDFSGFAIR